MPEQVINPSHVLGPVIHGKVIGPAMPTPAEEKLREEFDRLDARLRSTEAALESRLKHADEKIRAAVLEAKVEAARAKDRIQVLESRWYERFARWVRSWL